MPEAGGHRDPGITDGEFRRAWFHLDFLQQLDGITVTGNIARARTPPRRCTWHHRG